MDEKTITKTRNTNVSHGSPDEVDSPYCVNIDNDNFNRSV